MRILHTSDWHIGRTFMATRTLDRLAVVLAALVDAVREHSIDVVVASGDIFDSSTPSAEAFEMLDQTLVEIRGAGAQVVLISGNHDSAARLGARAVFAAAAGVHVLTRPETLGTPVTIDGVHFYGIPFLEPSIVRSIWPELPMRSQADAIGHAMDLIRTDLARRGGRSVVLAHTFAQGAEGESCESERDITTISVGGVDKVPVSAFDGVDYAALGHIHGRAVLSEHVRYCGAPLHYSFSEAGKPRGGWIVEIGPGGLESVDWLDLPVPVPAVRLKDTLDNLLTGPSYQQYADHLVEATLTDTVRPTDAMARLRARFPHCLHVVFDPTDRVGAGVESYRAVLADLVSDQEVVDRFLVRVRNGVGASHAEAELIDQMVTEHRAAEASR